MRLLLSFLVLALLPVLPAGLVEEFCPESSGKESDVHKRFESELVNWLQVLCAEKQYPRTWLSGAQDAAIPIEIRAVKGSKLTYRLLENTGAFDTDGKPERVPGADDLVTDIAKWPHKYLVGTFPVETSKDDAQMVRFAIWLKEERKVDLANRVLTVLHARAKPEVKAMIEQWLRDNCKFKPESVLVAADIYDTEFRLFRKELRPDADAKKIAEDREKVADGEWRRIWEVFANRKDLLARIEFDLRMLERDFGDTAKVKGLEVERNKLSKQIADARVRIQTQIDLAASHAGAPDKAAECWAAASADDPCNAEYSSKCANLWMQHANVQTRSKTLLQVTRETSLKTAKAILEKLKDEFPAHAGILLNYALCVHFDQNFKAAKALYSRVIELDPKGEKGQYGSVAKQRMQYL